MRARSGVMRCEVYSRQIGVGMLMEVDIAHLYFALSSRPQVKTHLDKLLQQLCLGSMHACLAWWTQPREQHLQVDTILMKVVSTCGGRAEGCRRL